MPSFLISDDNDKYRVLQSCISKIKETRLVCSTFKKLHRRNRKNLNFCSFKSAMRSTHMAHKTSTHTLYEHYSLSTIKGENVSSSPFFSSHDGNGNKLYQH